jgi:apolipoprotein N-acyltransferase
VLSELTWYQAGAMVERVPLYSGTTPAMFFGQTFEIANMVAAIGFLFAFGIRRKRR